MIHYDKQLCIKPLIPNYIKTSLRNVIQQLIANGLYEKCKAHGCTSTKLETFCKAQLVCSTISSRLKLCNINDVEAMKYNNLLKM